MAEANNFFQLFVKLLDNKTLTLQLPTHQTLTTEYIKQQIETLTLIPAQSQKLTLNGKFIDSSTVIPPSLSLSTIYLTFSLLGGKGGFGSLLRGAATKAGQKKTNNFDACRDMSGRRLRHVNAEKRLEEWKAEEEERKLEKMADEYLKKMAKKVGKKEGGGEEDKYVKKYREESARCVEEVERSVRESVGELLLGGKKRKLMDMLKGKKKKDCGLEGVDNAKKLKIWMGKRTLGESDSDDSDDDDDENNDTDVENEKSIVIDNGNQSDSSKDASCGSVSVNQLDGECTNACSSDSGSEEEKATVTGGSIGLAGTSSGSIGHVSQNGHMEVSPDTEKLKMDQPKELSVSEEVVCATGGIVVEGASSELNSKETTVGKLPSTSGVKEDGPEGAAAVPECQPASAVEGVTSSSIAPDMSQLLNLNDFNSAAELEVVGMERLKSELQAGGLKCGGTLKERAARLFLLKTTPLDKLPKKLLAKK